MSAEGATIGVSWPSIQTRDLTRLLAIYLLLVGYSFVYDYFFTVQLQKLFFQDYLRVDFARVADYRLTELLTPLALLPLGSRLHGPGQYIIGLLGVMIFIPTPIVFLSLLPSPQYWHVYVYYWFGTFLASYLAQLHFPFVAKPLSERGFQITAFAILAILALELAFQARHGLSLPSVRELDAARAAAEIDPAGGYAIYMFTCAFGGFAAALGVLQRRWLLVVFSLAGFAVCFGILAIKTAVLAPFWILYCYLAQRYFFRSSMFRYYLAVMFPFLFSVAAILLTSQIRQSVVLYEVVTVVTYRLFTVPAEAFGVYYNFFQIHPYTLWSHINVIHLFVRYPYIPGLGEVMQDAYRLGHYNASYIVTEGIASGGVSAIPAASLVFGILMALMNSAFRGLNATFVAIVVALPAITFIDSPMGTAFVTSGIGFLALLCFFAPRNASWNRAA